MRMDVFEIEAILSICLYQRFFTIVVFFGSDTLITKSHFCSNPIVCGVS